MLTVTAGCDGPQPLHGSATTTLAVQPVEHVLEVSASCDADVLPSGGTANCTATFTDSRPHGIASWQWDDGGAGGAFGPSGEVQNPTYTAPANVSDDDLIVTLTVTAACDGPDLLMAADTADLTVRPTGMFSDVGADHLMAAEIEACFNAGIVTGFDDGLYHPELPVTRGQMAAYVSRALAGGDDGVPDFADTPTFPDVDADHWALDYVEYAVQQAVVAGHADGNYYPEYEVTRDQMAVYVARAMVAPTGEAALADYEPSDPRNFPDVDLEFWAYRHVEYCVEHGVVQGYEDGHYYPDVVVTRAHMAVYIARAFDLPI